ncbi:putative molybdenum ABC transporter substrate binding protein [Phycisphaera mikurensis NBRC 102666]|uniref:Putative molybdenum ABC transporter substrate binding protein n=1 Tax=Phycisphaera mikurensis (strain NBRC 102666 / KCTC 22515 / FYK2301M01) TaxID=1142394 RepID=I0IFN4_PHYMF|nr:putative molybdenum ABC transporter substrate binding protein [Phycisphaera mikurensis NBRC 102666]
MRAGRLLSLLVALAAGAAAGCGEAGPPPLRVGVASSLGGVVDTLIGGDERVEVVAASSGRLAAQTRAGAGFDVLVLAGTERMERLAEEGRVLPATVREVADNRLVLAARRADPTRPGAHRVLAVAEPATVPLGRYTRQAIASGRLRTPLPPAVVYGASAAQVAAFLRAGEVDLAFLYASDAGPGSGLLVVEEVAGDAHEAIAYPGAVVAGAADPARAAALLGSLTDGRGRAAFRAAGFSDPPGG